MKCTIKDIARAADVAPSTVSRVISGSPRISRETQARVKKIMDELDYQPNLMARSLVSRSSSAFGVFLKSNPAESMKHPFFAEVLRGLGAQAAQRGLQMLLAASPSPDEDEASVTKLMRSGMISGMVLLSTHHRDPVPELLTSSRFPFVVIGHPDDTADCWYVDNNNEEISFQAAQYLTSLGHRRVVVLGGGDGYTVTSQRESGYRRALAGADFVPDRDIFPDPLDHREAVARVFQGPNPPTAALCQDDSIAVWLIGLLNSIGLGVPGDVSVIGFNNSPIAPYTSPPLTSIEINAFELGSAAAQMLLGQADSTARSRIVPATLIKRGSVQGI